MQRAIARQAEAERERRAKIISADGEFQAAEKLAQAANIISANPATLQLRYLQTLLDIGVNQNSTIIFPLPLDMIKPFLGFDGGRRPARARGRRSPEGHRAVAERSRGPHRPAHRAAGDPGARAGPSGPDAFVPAPAADPGGRRRDLPVLRGPRGPHPAGGLGAPPGGGEPDSPGWTARAVPNLYPVLAAVDGRRAPGDGHRAASRGAGDRPGELDRPAAGLDPGGRAGPVRVAARRGRPRGDRPRPRARDLAGRALRGALRGRGRRPGGSACGPTPRMPPTST